MEPWKTFIGNGTGVFVMMRPEIANGAILSDDYLGTLNTIAGLALPNIKKEVAESYGIFPNSADKKVQFLKRIKTDVFRVDAAEYVFNQKFYYNPTLDQNTTLQYLQENDFNTFLTHPDTKELTAGNGADFLNYLL